MSRAFSETEIPDGPDPCPPAGVLHQFVAGLRESVRLRVENIPPAATSRSAEDSSYITNLERR